MHRLLVLASMSALIGLLAGAVDAPARAEDGDKDKKAPEHKVTQSESYLALDPIYATIVQDNRPVGLLMVGIGVDVPDAALRAEIDRSMPVLRDAYVRALLSFAVTSVHLDSQPDVGMIAGRLQTVTDRTLKQKGVKVLLGQVALRATPPKAR